MTLHTLSLIDVAAKIKAKELSSREATQALLSRIEAVDPKINSFVSVLPERALEQADRADKALAAGEATGPLHGVPLGLKDIFCTKGVRTTCGSRILRDFVPPYDAAVVEKVEGAGAVVLGKQNMDEFAMGSSTETSHFGPSLNPWDVTRIPGGSSGGTAAGVAAGLCFGAFGTDTGGSIRQPASLCGVVGLKPTYGRVSRWGMIAFASSLDQAGPVTRTVADSALLLGVVAGHDRRDSTSVDLPVPDYVAATRKSVKGMKIGLPKEYFEAGGLDPEVKAAVNKALEALLAQGAEAVEVSLPNTEYALSTYYLIAPAEASSNLARYDGVRYGHRAETTGGLIEMMSKTRAEGFGPEVKRRIMIGTYALSAGYYEAYYGRAQKMRTLIRKDFADAFAKVDAILTPTAPTPAFKVGEKTDDPLTMYLSDVFTIPCNLAGVCGISVPCGMAKGNLPIGAQLLAGHFREETLITAAAAIERALPGPGVAPVA